MRHERILAAHGTRNLDGLRTITDIASAVGELVGPVRTSFVDVVGPDPGELLADVDAPVVLVPVFLASGYHVRSDLPGRVAASGHPAVTITPALGPDPALAEVMHARLVEVGWTSGDTVVMAAAGSSDAAARRDVTHAAALLANLVGPVHLGFVATGEPRVADVVNGLRNAGHRRIAVASYLLAPGVFHTRLQECGADAVAPPLGAHPALAGLLARRLADHTPQVAGGRRFG